MDILGLTESIMEGMGPGLPFTLYRGNGRHPLDPEAPYVMVTLADIPGDLLPADKHAYSWIDFAHDPESGIIHSPNINLIHAHRGGKVLYRLNRVMEEVGRRMGFTRIRAYNIINHRLKGLMPRFGYDSSGTDQRGDYLERML